MTLSLSASPRLCSSVLMSRAIAASLNLPQSSHHLDRRPVAIRQLPIQRINLFVRATSGEVRPVDQVLALAGDGVDGLADLGVAGDGAAGGEAAEDGGAEGDGLVGF